MRPRRRPMGWTLIRRKAQSPPRFPLSLRQKRWMRSFPPRNRTKRNRRPRKRRRRNRPRVPRRLIPRPQKNRRQSPQRLPADKSIARTCGQLHTINHPPISRYSPRYGRIAFDCYGAGACAASRAFRRYCHRSAFSAVAHRPSCSSRRPMAWENGTAP